METCHCGSPIWQRGLHNEGLCNFCYQHDKNAEDGTLICAKQLPEPVESGSIASMIEFPTEQSEVVELPVIMVGTKVQLISPDLRKLDISTMKLIAQTMKGELRFLKVRATYTPVEVQMCTKSECYRPAVPNSLVCSDHE